MRRFFTRFLCALLCVGGLPALAAVDIYVDSTNVQSGDGSEFNPYNRLALINWSFVASNVASGLPVTINLKRGSTFLETLTVGASGTANAPIAIQDYGEGELPVIRGDNVLTGWTQHPSGLGQTWSVSWPGAVFYVWLDGVRASKGQSSDSLNDKEWFSSGGRLYLRHDAGNPDVAGPVVTISARNHAVSILGRRFIRLEHLDFRGTSSYLVRMANSEAIELQRCQLLQAGGHLDINSVTNARVLACTFEDSYGLPMVNVAGTNTTADLFFCHLHNAAAGTAIQVAACQSVDIINCNIIGVRSRGVDNSSSGVVQIRNCLFSGIGNSKDVLGNESISSVAGSCRVGNSLVLPNGQNPTLHMKGVIDVGGNIFREPRFKQTRREGLWVIMEDDYGSLADWSVLARTAKSNYNYRISLALNNTDRIHPEHKHLLQELIFEGHDIVSHTRSHANLAEPDAFNIQYLGTGTNCTLIISNNWLTTAVSGAVTNDNLSIDLSSSSVDRLEKIIPYVDRLSAYACSYTSVRASYNHAVPTRLLQEVAGVDIKSASYKAVFNKGQFYTNEIWQSKADLEATFIDAAGAPYECRYLIYPGGYSNHEVISEAIAAGYWGGRTDSPVGQSWQMDKFDMFLTQVAVGINGNMLNIPFENNATDYSIAQNAFSISNVMFSTKAYRLSFAGKFNGSNAFLSRLTNPHFDFSKGDWHLSVRLWPGSPAGNRTVFFMGSDSSNYSKAFVDDQGALRLLLVSDGEQILSLGTSNGTVHTNGWQKISIQQLFDRWMIRVNDVLVLDTTNSARLKPYTGSVFIGCSRDYSSGGNADFYSGLMDDFVMSNGTFYKTQAAADLMSECGGFLNAMSHGESGTPREVWRIVFDALKDYSGRLNVMTYTEASDYVRSNGVLQSDLRTVVRTSWPGQPDYNLRPDSPCVGAAANDAVEGISNLIDANGMPVTDALGQIVVAGTGLSIGAFQLQLQVISTQLPPARVGSSYFASLTAAGGVNAYQWSLAAGSLPLPPGLTLSSEGLLSGQADTSGGFVITVEVTDGTGQKAQQTIPFQVQAQLSLARIESFSFQPDGTFRLRVHVEPDGVLAVEASTNLIDWVSAGSMVVTNAVGVWDDMMATNFQQRFYRIRF